MAKGSNVDVTRPATAVPGKGKGKALMLTFGGAVVLATIWGLAQGLSAVGVSTIIRGFQAAKAGAKSIGGWG